VIAGSRRNAPTAEPSHGCHPPTHTSLAGQMRRMQGSGSRGVRLHDGRAPGADQTDVALSRDRRTFIARIGHSPSRLCGPPVAASFPYLNWKYGSCPIALNDCNEDADVSTE
jgi:hypothetical protein